MPDSSYLLDLFLTINESVDLVIRRSEKIRSETDFIDSEEGSMILDSISMRLHFIGETLKRIEKHDPAFLKKYNKIEWDPIIRLRDFISHHYDLLDYQVIFRICKIHLPELRIELVTILSDLGHYS